MFIPSFLFLPAYMLQDQEAHAAEVQQYFNMQISCNFLIEICSKTFLLFSLLSARTHFYCNKARWSAKRPGKLSALKKIIRLIVGVVQSSIAIQLLSSQDLESNLVCCVSEII